jgi:hypothetical protein
MAKIARAYRPCKVQAVERAVAQIDSPMVQQRYAANIGGATVPVAEAKR